MEPTALSTHVVIDAFNLWMKEYTEEPEKFKNHTKEVLDFVKESLDGNVPTYGQEAAATLYSYIKRVME